MSLNILDIVSKGLIEQLDLKPLVGDETAEFRLIRAGMIDPTSTKAVSTPQYQGIAGLCDINDPYDKSATVKRIMNITGYNSIKGKPGEPTYMDPIVGSVAFLETGSIICTSQDNNKYLFLKLHNKNRDNPNRRTRTTDGRGIPAVFYEVDVKKEIKTKTNGFDYRFLASKAVFEADDDGIFNIATKLQRAYPKVYTFDMKAEVDVIRTSLQSAAETDAVNFILAVKEPTSFARLLVDDAIARKLIMFDSHEEKLTWMWKRNAGQKGKVKILKLEKGNNPERALVEFLTTADGSTDMVEMRQLYEEYYLKK